MAGRLGVVASHYFAGERREPRRAASTHTMAATSSSIVANQKEGKKDAEAYANTHAHAHAHAHAHMQKEEEEEEEEEESKLSSKVVSVKSLRSAGGPKKEKKSVAAAAAAGSG